MARYIDADALIEKFKAEHDWSSVYIVEDMPTADVINRNECSKCVLHPFKQLREQLETNMVEVVQCKDCMHTEIDKYAPAECQNRCKLSQQYHEPTFFCKCGEPRTDLLEWIHRGDDDEQGV